MSILAASRPLASSLRAAPALASAARHMSTSQPRQLESITVFGAGLMGAGIAQVSAAAGYRVILSDVTDKALDDGLNIISKSLGRIAKKKQPDDIEGFTKKVMANIETTTDPAKAVADTDLVVEAIIENIKVKRDLFGFLDTKAKPSAIFASNTSSLAITDIAEACSDARQPNFAGLHFFNPVPQMKLVEIIRTERTSDETFQALREMAVKMQKAPVTCKDTPGFIVNRLLVPYMMEAVRMVERGDATPEDIDTAMKLGAGYPMGPFELLDFVGLDTTHYIAEGWVEKAKLGLISEELVEPTKMLGDLVAQGHMGRKSGRGIYDYSQKK